MWAEALEYADLLAGTTGDSLREVEGGTFLLKTGALIRVPQEDLPGFSARPFLPDASALVAPALKADASGARALKAAGKAYGWGHVKEAWLLRAGEPIPEALAPWAPLLEESFRRYGKPLYLVVRFRRKKAPLLLGLSPL
mgnify:CR=1 FL=1